MKTAMVVAGLAGLVAIFSLAQDRVNDGKVRVADERQTLDRGRLGTEESMPPGPLTLNGILVDAGCNDRTQSNLLRPPEPLAQLGPAEPPQMASSQEARRAQTGFATGTSEPAGAGVSAFGITVDAQTLASERADVLEHQVPDLVSRQEDPTCAINARTSNFALLMDNGRLLNLDGGGNVWAWQAVQSSTAGTMMLNGKGPASKPRVTIVGTIRGDRLTVDSLKLS